ncbi:isoleucine--tRNA ligase [Nanoarchaeota archaeon]
MYDFNKTEEDILKFWKQKKIYEKLVKKNSNGKKFYFMDGPPYATGHIHMGTALNKILKDISMRYKRLTGNNVFDKPGYDTHGLPIENGVEKKLGFKKKEDIEKYGVKKFIKECKNFATKYIDVMNNDFANLGVWMDWKNPYLTLENNYLEAIWDTFKKAEEKDLLYLGKYPIHACTHCETAVAYNEIEYTKQEDISVYVKFKIKSSKNKYLIIWTTTPWTLPSNTGIMVHPKFDYVEVKVGNEIWIIAKERLAELMKGIKTGYRIVKEFKGKELDRLEYENALSKHLKLAPMKNAYKVVLNERYVNLEEGTGLVHTAPGCGKEDFEAGQKSGLPVVSIVDINGNLTEEGGKYAGKKARVVDEEIIQDLEKDNALIYKHPYTHDYPICWRCTSPLIMISAPQWFFKIKKIQNKIIKTNETVAWLPRYMKLRMRAWLEGISDWPISRNRYWGTPLPIWLCDKCEEKDIIGSIKELEKKAGKKIKEVHKPDIDSVVWKCKCGGKKKRVSEVLDVWFDSGVSSWAALGYPQNDKLFKEFWPADLNIEGKDQFRGWWNSQLILSEIRFGKKPYKNIVVHGMVMDIGKIKMSKSLGNITSPEEVIEKYGRDAMRYYFAKVSKGEDFSFDGGEFKDIMKVFRVLINLNNFINQLQKGKQKLEIEDKWILSRFNSTIKDIQNNYDKFNFPKVVQSLESFMIDDLSKKYIQIIRDRSGQVYDILTKIRNDLFVVVAPILPFITEHAWQDLKKKKIVKEESVHLCAWPSYDKKKINSKLEKEFDSVFLIIEKGLAERDKEKIGLKWPLAKATVSIEKKLSRNLYGILFKQLNIKKLDVKSGKELTVKLDTKQTPELETEGYAREVSRKIQAFRRDLGLQRKDKVETIIITDDKFKKMLETQKDLLKQRTNSKKLNIVTTSKERFKNKVNFRIKDKRGELAIIC